MTIIEGSAAVAVGIDAAVVANHYIVVRRPEAGRPGTVVGDEESVGSRRLRALSLRPNQPRITRMYLSTRALVLPQ
jgi:hypothetical protein